MYGLKKKEKVIIWGCGKTGDDFVAAHQDELEVEFYIDSKVPEGEMMEHHGCAVYNPSKVKDIKNRKVILAIRNWRECITLMEECNKEIFDDYLIHIMYNEQMIDVSFYDLVKDKNRMREYICASKGRKKVVFAYGMCHMWVYRDMLNACNDFKKKYIFVDLPLVYETKLPHYGTLGDEYVWSAVDVVLMNPEKSYSGVDLMSFDRIKQWVPDNTQVIQITNAACRGYFLQHKMAKGNTYRFCWGDKNIDKLCQEGKNIDEIKAIILNENFYSKEKVLRWAHHAIELLRLQEEECDVKIADFVEEHFNNKLLYYSCTHPTTQVMYELAKRIAKLLGIKDLEIPMEDDLYYQLDGHEEIVYPSVVKHLGLPESVMCRKYNPGDYYGRQKKISIEQYITEYVLCRYEQLQGNF